MVPVNELSLDWSVGLRTGDTTSSERARQSKRLPTALITTPESLTLLLTRPDATETFASLQMVVIDEWHELIGNKRGVQLQLALARLRRWQPALITWGLSATLGNLQHAMDVLIPSSINPILVQGKLPKDLIIDTLLPPGIERFPWAGHLGLRMLPQVVEQIESSASSLIFTNTRSQCEIWYQALLEARPDWAGIIALHHGSFGAGPLQLHVGLGTATRITDVRVQWPDSARSRTAYPSLALNRYWRITQGKAPVPLERPAVPFRATPLGLPASMTMPMPK